MLPTGEEIAWQAQYFLSLDLSQWSQIDDSVKTALEKHPRLIRYYVCVPVDLPDARLPGQTSGYQKWLDRVTKWSDWAAAKGMSVEFVWSGSHEMLEKLALPVNSGLARFWFDAAVLDSLWFDKRLQEAIVTAGPRYTPEVNVDLPIMQDFDAFGRTDTWVKRLKKFAAQISKVNRLASYDLDKLGAQRSELDKVLTLVGDAISMIREITVEPTSPVSFGSIVDQIKVALAAIHSVSSELSKSERLEDEKPTAGADRSYRENPFRSSRFRLHDVERDLNEAVESLTYTETLAQSALLLLDGTAGMGKTHLLCDLASKRQQAGLPTILLMGQRFLQPAEPWTQVLQQLDLAQWSAEDFVGALEAVGQSANSRVLVMIDALNEGAGRAIWPNHMSAFLQLMTRSLWIAVVVSVRSNYEQLVLPSSVLQSATRVTHEGFADHEYNASKTFFKHYGIELPSTPLLAPEYRSPLFLKSICVGLKDAGHTRLPRGFHGISQVFRLYTNAINLRLAGPLDFDPRSQLVQKALKSFVAAFPSHREQWLSRVDAIALVDAILPNRTFQNSLYQALVGEGLLVEDLIRMGDGDEREFVHLGYERLADHFTAEFILENVKKRTATKPPAQEPLTDDDDRLSSGVLESLFIQAPETLKQELMDFVPTILSHWQWPDAYRQSLIWRTPDAFTDRTLYWFNQSLARDSDEVDAVEIALTLASVPAHPWNASFLDRQLRKRKMAVRDEWWTIKIHSLYSDKRSAVHRVIDWALSVKTTDTVDEESVQLVSLTLGWMLSSSNRFLRDRATKAAVNLLSGRERLAAVLVRSFATVDDLYIRERVLAIAYGVAMRSSDPARIQPLADSVFETVFAEPPATPHLLLRDHARGVIERLHSLAPQPEEIMDRIRPPYGSKWPRIPSKEAVKRLEDGFKADGTEAYGARRIAFSVLHDDFGRYVIGTNSWSTDWLSLRLDKPIWRSYADRLREFKSELDPELTSVWDAYTDAESKLAQASVMRIFAELRPLGISDGGTHTDTDAAINETTVVLEEAEKALLSRLSREQSTRLKTLWKLRGSPTATRAPKFDLHLIQRYVVKRVFALGWTINRFDYFDNNVIRYDGRNASKAERIGKKYQWIAYHEICALVADNFQFRNEIGSSGLELTYQGPWQDYSRDLDPSHSFLSTTADANSEGGWWAPRFEPDWGDEQDGSSWAENVSDFPDLASLVQKTDADGRSWLVADLSFNRNRPIPEGMDREDVESRTFWCHLRSFLIRNGDVDAFVQWAEGVDFWGQWMPTVPSSYKLCLGEYLWSPAWKHFDNSYYGNDGWVRPGHGCPVSIRTSAFEYHQESAGFDCSVDSGFTLHLPDAELVKAMNLTWTGDAADFRNSDGEIVTKDPSAYESGPAALLLRGDRVEELTRTKGLSVCWMVLGERQAYLPGPMKHLGAVRISGACSFKNGTLRGFVHFRKDEWTNEETVGKTITEKRF